MGPVLTLVAHRIVLFNNLIVDRYTLSLAACQSIKILKALACSLSVLQVIFSSNMLSLTVSNLFFSSMSTDVVFEHARFSSFPILSGNFKSLISKVQ